MKQITELGNMDCDTLSSSCEFEEKGSEKTTISDQINRLQYSTSKPDNFIVDMERFSHFTSKDVDVTPNSRITLQRNLSRKGSLRGSEKKMNENDRSDAIPNSSSSPREKEKEKATAASLMGTGTPEKPTLVDVGATNNPHLHHPITISTGKVGTGTGTPTAESRFATRRLISFKRSSPTRIIDPRRILFIFATLSSMGSILLIYFTLSMGKA